MLVLEPIKEILVLWKISTRSILQKLFEESTRSSKNVFSWRAEIR